MAKPAISVIIPTYNRMDALPWCLRALEGQTHKDFEVVLVNDGSTDESAAFLEQYCASTPLRIRVFHQANGGPARARNLAIRAVESDVALLIGDDIFATPSFVATHLAFHLDHPEWNALALGLTVWDSVHQTITPFMRWYEAIQFDYRSLLAGANPDWRYCYTSNLSFKTELIRQNSFDERFSSAAWEDSELGYRLQKKGLFQLTFLRDAVATHLHPMTFQRAVARMRTAGRMEHLFHDLHPELRSTHAPSSLHEKVVAFVAQRGWLLKAAEVSVRLLPFLSKPQMLVLAASQRSGYAIPGTKPG